MPVVTTTEVMTFERALKRAMAELRKNGVQARLNVMGCCRSCISADAERVLRVKDKTQPIIWHYGGQGSRVVFSPRGEAQRVLEVRPWYSRDEDQRDLQMYFNHDNGGAELALPVLHKYGIDARWDGSEFKCLEVYPYGYAEYAADCRRRGYDPD